MLDYQRGLEQLKTAISLLPPETKDEFATLATRLQENLRDEQRYGSEPGNRAERYKIIDALNRYARVHTGTPFNDFCQSESMPRSPHLQHPTPTMLRDVGIVIALPEEFAEFYTLIKDRSRSLRDQTTGTYYYFFEHASKQSQHVYQCAATLVGEMGQGATGLATQALIQQWQPRTLVILGLAAALSSDVRPGDVVIANQVDAYIENAKAVPASDPREYGFTLSGEVYRSSSALVQGARNFQFAHHDEFAEWRQHCASDLKRFVPAALLENLLAQHLLHDEVQLLTGHLASGPLVGAAQTFTTWLKTRDRKYLALEMETAGFMAAVYRQADPQHTLVLRAISDYGDEHKHRLDTSSAGMLRRSALHNASHLLWKFLDAGILPYHP